MKITQVPVDRHPLLVSLWEILAAPSVTSLLESAARLDDHKDVWADIAAGPPAQERLTAAARNCYWLRRCVEAARAKHVTASVRGAYYYPPGGGMGWHTNMDDPGWRAYVVVGTGGLMGTRDNGFYLDRDAHANVFRIGPEEDPWHCVAAVAPRRSFGVKLPDDLAAAILG